MKRFLMLLVVLIACIPFWNAYAGKPTPTPYPLPAESMAYIPPEEPPTVSFLDQLYAQSPLADPTPGVPYGWGLFPVVANGQTRFSWWVTIEGVGKIDWVTDGSACVGIVGEVSQNCKLLLFYQYDPIEDVNLFEGPFNPYCDVRVGFRNIYLYGRYGTWREPNTYFYNCVYLPNTKRQY